MAPLHVPFCARKTQPARLLVVVLSFASVLATALTSLGLAQGVNHTGRWTPSHATNGVAIHLTLLPGDSTLYHSEILYWSGENDEEGPFNGGLWGWQPLGYDCTSFPTTNSLQAITLPVPAGGVFCGSNSHLASPNRTQLFVAGGTQPGTENGVRHVYVFNPATVTWSLVDSMTEDRWYATSTALSDSRQLVLSGSKDLSLDFFGGLRNAEVQPRDRGLFRYGIGANGNPEHPVYSGSGSEWPTPRRGHTMVRNNAWRMFGGRDSVQYFDDYWELGRGDTNAYGLGPDFDYKWTRYANISIRPAARHGHVAIMTSDPAAEMIIFGGIKKTLLGDSVAVDDVWRLHKDPDTQQPVWSQVSIQDSPNPDDPPGARCGHVAFYDAPSQRMLVFGGRSSPTGTPTKDSLYALEFDDASFTSATWHKLGATGPSARFDHAGVYDPGWVIKDSSYAFVFGGQRADGSKDNELWELRVHPNPVWRKVELQGTKPSPRSGHSMSTLSRRLYIFGGNPRTIPSTSPA